jgi:phosphopantothenate--cysteine ligase
MKGKKILVTAGGTQEYIDEVRILTNISSGKLGALISNQLIEEHAAVYYVCGQNSTVPDKASYIHKVKTAQDAMTGMKQIMSIEKFDAVIHCMAVSDFTFERGLNIKCKSSDPEAFIEYMRQTIKPNPKIIGMIKQWGPKTILIGFKFEVGKTKEQLVALAEASIEKNGCDLVIANDKTEMAKSKSHIGHFVFSNAMKELHGIDNFTAFSKDHIAVTVKEFLKRVFIPNC